MQSQQELLALLTAANEDFAAANAAGKMVEATLIESEVITPLKGAMVAVALGSLSQQAAQLNAISEKLELALVRLTRRIDRLFIDRILTTADGVGLAAPAATHHLHVEHVESVDAPEVAAASARVSAETTRPPAHSTTTRNTRIEISDRDLDALARVAASEVGHFGKFGEDQLRGALGAVVDTILNRVANPGFPDTIEAVVDQPKQFSAINELATWAALPQASPVVFVIVEDHVAQRVAGKASEIQGATHFFNPHLSSTSALETWGHFVVRNAVAVFGDDTGRDVHFHGTALGTPATPSYTLVRRGIETTFAGTGEAPGGAPATANLRRNIARICREEATFFRHGEAKETDDPQFLRVADYWRAIGKPFNGRTIGDNGERIAWSSAFIGFVLKAAGAGDRFPGSPGHCFYFQHFVNGASYALYRAVPASQAVPQPGDIVHYGRGTTAERFDFTAARLAFDADGFYPSHSSLVTEVDAAAGVLKTIGGNESDSVMERSVPIGDDGLLKPRKSGSKKLPWIGVLVLA